MGWLLTAVAIVLFVVAATLLARTLSRIRSGGRARGVVIGSEKVMPSRGGSATFRPKVEFASRDGRRHAFTSAVGYGTAWPNGKAVAVVYDPANPADAEVAAFATQWMMPVVLALFGGVALAVGLGIVR